MHVAKHPKIDNTIMEWVLGIFAKFWGILVYSTMLGWFVALQLFYLGTNDQYVPFLDICGPILAVLWLFFAKFRDIWVYV